MTLVIPTHHGFRFGRMVIEATSAIEGRTIVTIETDAGRAIQVTCSATGRSLRVFQKDGGKELK